MPSNILSHSPPNDIPRNILAFRTITTMLHHIQQERPFKISDSNIPDEHSQELKLSNALATVAVADHNVVAVAMVHSAEGLKVIACTQWSNNKGPLSQSSTVLQHYWRLFFTKNPRRDEGQENDYPVVVDAKAPPDCDEAKVDAHVENCW